MNPLVFKNAANEIVFVHASYVVIGKENADDVCIMTSAHLDVDGREKGVVATVTEPHLIPHVTMEDLLKAYKDAQPRYLDQFSRDVIDLRPLQARKEKAKLEGLKQ